LTDFNKIKKPDETNKDITEIINTFNIIPSLTDILANCQNDEDLKIMLQEKASGDF
jgi:hypothetical protein